MSTLPSRAGQPPPADPTSERQFEAYSAKEMPPVEEVAPGVWSLPLPLVQLPIRYVLTYLLETPDGPVLIDAGWPDETSWQALEECMAEVGHRVADLHGLVLTHAHPDHHGLTERIRSVSKAWVAAHALDVPAPGAVDGPAIEAAELRSLRLQGMPDATARQIAEQFARSQQMEGIRGPQPDVLVADGDALPIAAHDAVAVWTPGHTSGHLCLWLRSARLLVSGDHLLPRISPGVGLSRAAGGGDPLGDYLASLRRVGSLPVDEVLPAHEYRFAGVAERVDDLLAHHEHRLGEVRTALAAASPRPAWDIAQQLTWSRPWDEIHEWMQRAAMFETVAHLTVLERRGEAVPVDGEPRTWALPEQ